jgi:hypothetical protein
MRQARNRDQIGQMLQMQTRIEKKKTRWDKEKPIYSIKKKDLADGAHTSAYSVDGVEDGLAEVDIAADGSLAGGRIALRSPCAPRGSPEEEKTKFA